MRLIADGLITKEIAARLGIAYETVRKHRNNAFAKLGCNTAGGAVARWMGWRSQE